MKVEILIETNNNNEIIFTENYEVTSRDSFRELMYKIEDIKDNLEDEVGQWCTITVNFDWDEADELDITEEDIDIC